MEKYGYYDLKISIRNHPIYTTVDKVFYMTDYTGFTNLEESIIDYVTTFDWETKKQKYQLRKSSSKNLDATENNLKSYKKENQYEVDMLINIIKKRSNIDGKQVELNSINTLLLSVTHLSKKEKLRLIKDSLTMQINKPVHIIPIKQHKGVFITKIEDYKDVVLFVNNGKAFLTEIN
ncbi:hypothetical protein [Oceanobacillus sojae]|uniref:hypothetical protein n=2 Tax=Oceanobacillus TaxID=182709 RepID=UPI00363B36BD